MAISCAIVRICTAFQEIATPLRARNDSSSRGLVLVEKGGTPLKSTRDHLRFFLLNPRKLVFLPDDKHTRAFVAEFYGPEDIREPKGSY